MSCVPPVYSRQPGKQAGLRCQRSDDALPAQQLQQTHHQQPIARVSWYPVHSSPAAVCRATAIAAATVIYDVKYRPRERYRKSLFIKLLKQILRGGPKMAPFLYALIKSNISRFSKLFHFQNQEKICNNTITKDPTIPQVCRYTTL